MLLQCAIHALVISFGSLAVVPLYLEFLFLTIIALLTTKVEYIALSTTLRNAIYVMQLLK